MRALACHRFGPQSLNTGSQAHRYYPPRDSTAPLHGSIFERTARHHTTPPKSITVFGFQKTKVIQNWGGMGKPYHPTQATDLSQVDVVYFSV